MHRTTTPKVKAVGKLAASCSCWAYLEFEIVTDAESRLTVSGVEADVVIDALPLRIVESTHGTVVRALLKIFSKKGKETVQREIRDRVQSHIAVAQAKVITRLRGCPPRSFRTVAGCRPSGSRCRRERERESGAERQRAARR